jgi:hypothetical protein
MATLISGPRDNLQVSLAFSLSGPSLSLISRHLSASLASLTLYALFQHTKSTLAARNRAVQPLQLALLGVSMMHGEKRKEIITWKRKYVPAFAPFLDNDVAAVVVRVSSSSFLCLSPISRAPQNSQCIVHDRIVDPPRHFNHPQPRA